MPDRFHQSHLYEEFRIINPFRKSQIKFSESKDLGLKMNSVPELNIDEFFLVPIVDSGIPPSYSYR